MREAKIHLKMKSDEPKRRGEIPPMEQKTDNHQKCLHTQENSFVSPRNQ